AADLHLLESVSALVRRHVRLPEDLLRLGLADSVDVGERDLHPLVTRQGDASDASHGSPSPLESVVRALALALLVPRVLADDANHALAAHDLALVADLLDGGADLHGFALFCRGSPGDTTGRTGVPVEPRLILPAAPKINYKS